MVLQLTASTGRRSSAQAETSSDRSRTCTSHGTQRVDQRQNGTSVAHTHCSGDRRRAGDGPPVSGAICETSKVI